GLKSHVNLIPFNPWESSGFTGSTGKRLKVFERTLAAEGVSVSVRFSRGRDAGAACGQLALQGSGDAANPSATAPTGDSLPVLSSSQPPLASEGLSRAGGA